MCHRQRVNNSQSYWGLWNVENTGEEMFGKKGIKRFFFSWQKTDHDDEVLQEKTGDLDQVKGNFLIRLLSWLFIPWLLLLPVHTPHLSWSISIWHTHVYIYMLDSPHSPLTCQWNILKQYLVINRLLSLSIEASTLYSCHSMFSFKSGVKLGNFEAFREFIHKNVKLNYEGHSNSYSIFRRKLQNHLILKSSEMQTPKKELSCWITIHQGECTNKKIRSLEHFRNKILSFAQKSSSKVR